MNDKAVKDLLICMRALLAIQIDSLREADDRAKPEIVLARAGMPARDIGELIGKKQSAVAKAIQRSGKTAA